MLSLSSFGSVFLICNLVALFRLPRQWAIAPILICACYMTRGQGIEIGPFHFTVIRIMIAACFLRALLFGEGLPGKMVRMDVLMVLWGVWAMFTSIFHENIFAAIVYRLGLVYDVCGFFFIFRIFCKNFKDIEVLCVIVSVTLLPISIEMVNEKITGQNIFAAFGGVDETPPIRDGNIRAQGPFGHPILAGTVGASCLPLVVSLWHLQRKAAIIGILACLGMIIASASSGPLLTAFAGIGGLFMWRYRHSMRLVRWIVGGLYILMDLYMKDPAYYIMARIDLTGSSTGWHRARLIQSAFEHLGEWWLIGTDHTRHWMPTGIPASADHTDITNHYLGYGVLGGLPLMFIFIWILVTAFSTVGQVVREEKSIGVRNRFMVWALGASLFAHAVTFVAISYFDQSSLFIFLVLAAIASSRPVERDGSGKAKEVLIHSALNNCA